MKKKTLYVEISTLDYCVNFYCKAPRNYFGDVHGPYSTLKEAKKEAAKIMSSYLSEYRQMLKEIKTCKIKDFKKDL